MSPFLQCLCDCIKFFVICWVLDLRFIQFLTKVCDWLVVLSQDHSNCKSTHITLDLECLAKIWQNQNWLLSDLLLQQIETLLCFLCPVKRFMSFLHRIHHWCTNSTEISDEFSIEAIQTMEALNFKHSLRRWSILNRLYLFRIHFQFICRDNKTQINELCPHKWLFIHIDHQFLLL